MLVVGRISSHSTVIVLELALIPIFENISFLSFNAMQELWPEFEHKVFLLILSVFYACFLQIHLSSLN